MPWKHGNTLLSEISSFYVYALFPKSRTNLDSEPGTPPLLHVYLKEQKNLKLFKRQLILIKNISKFKFSLKHVWHQKMKVDQMLQNPTKQFYAFNKRTIFIRRIIYIFNKRIILIQQVTYIFNKTIIFIQWIIYVFNKITIFIKRNIYIFNKRVA